MVLIKTPRDTLPCSRFPALSRKTPHPADPFQRPAGKTGRPADPAGHRHRNPDHHRHRRAVAKAKGAITVGARKLQDILRSLPTTPKSVSPSTTSVLQVGPAKPLQPADPAGRRFSRMALTEGETRQFQLTQKAFRQLPGQDPVRHGRRTSATTSTACCCWPKAEGTCAHGRHRRPPPGLSPASRSAICRVRK